MTAPTCPTDREALVRYLQAHCRGEEHALHQEPLARALDFDLRHLQDVVSEEAQHNGHIGTSTRGVYWSENVPDYRAAYSNLAGRVGPIVRRMRAIERACPQVATETLLEA